MSRLKITAYTDGACKGNPGRGGWGVSYYFDLGENTQMEWVIYGGKMITTNNEMELTAFLEALKIIPHRSDILIHSDSQYVLKTLIKDGKNGNITLKKSLKDPKIHGDPIFTGYLGAWIKSGWKKKDGKVPSNLKLWQETVDQIKLHLHSGSTIRCRWVKGHSGNEGNDMADKLANMGVPKRN